jgi:hypothetical protein
VGSLRFVPPPNQFGTFVFTVEAKTRETSNGDTESTSRTISVSVAPKADAPEVTVKDATGEEDETIKLDLTAKLTDNDNSEVLSVVIEGLPDGARLSAGINNGDGSWTLTPAQLAGLTIAPPAEWSGTMALTMLAHSRERSNGSVATTQAHFQVQVGAAVDAPVVSAHDARDREDEPIALNLSAALTDRDGSEVLSVIISGVPSGASLSHGSRHDDGTWSVLPADLHHLTITAPENFSGSFELTMRATSRETSNGRTASTQTTFRVHVDPVADAPDVTVVNFSGQEDTAIRLTGLGGALRDTDGSESLSFVLSGLPDGATLNIGTKRADGTWLLTPAQLSEVILTPPANVSGRYTLTLTGVSAERGIELTASTSRDFTVEFNPVADAGTINGTSTGSEDTPIALKPSFILQDSDGSESWSEFTEVSGVPIGAKLSLGEELRAGVWKVSTEDLRAGLVMVHPSDHSDNDFTLTFAATITDTGNGTSASRVVTGTHSVIVNAVADAPIVHAGAVTGQEDQTIALDLSARLADTDGSETLSVSILGVPAGFTLSHGTLTGSEWKVPAEHLAGLKLIPADNWNGTLNLTLQATSTERTGPTTKTTIPFTVTIDPVNDAPVVELTAPAHAQEKAQQAHAIGDVQAHDIDSPHLGGATIVLSGGQPKDRLDFEGFALHDQDGRLMIGSTGIEVVGGGYVARTGTLTLSGSATPQTYAAVIKSLVLESVDGSGLASGSRSIGVTLQDSSGANSTQKSVDIVVDHTDPAPGASHDFAAASSLVTHNSSEADYLVLTTDPDSGGSTSVPGAWTEQIDPSHMPDATAHHTSMDLQEPAVEPAPLADHFHIDTNRVQWS